MFLELTGLIQAQRTPEEEGDYMAFEQLVAEAAMKKEKEKEDKKKRKDKKDKDKDKDKSHVAQAAATAADAPDVPKS